MKLKTFLIILAAILCVGLIAGGVARKNGSGSAQSVSVRPNSAANNGTAAATEAPATTEADEPATEPETDEVQGPKILLLIGKDLRYDFTVYEDGEEISPLDSVTYSCEGISPSNGRPGDPVPVTVDRYLVTPGNSSISCSAWASNYSKADVTDLIHYQYCNLARYSGCFDMYYDSVLGTSGSLPDWDYDIPAECVFFFVY